MSRHTTTTTTTTTTTPPVYGLFSKTTWVSLYQKGKTSLNDARDVMGFWDKVASAGPHANNLHLAPDR